MKTLLLLPLLLIPACKSTEQLDAQGNPIPRQPSAWYSTGFRVDLGFKGVSFGITVPSRGPVPEPVVTGKAPVPAP
jgi:hypothetical protein